MNQVSAGSFRSRISFSLLLFLAGKKLSPKEKKLLRHCQLRFSPSQVLEALSSKDRTVHSELSW